MSRQVLDKLCQRLGQGVIHTHSFRGDDTAIIAREHLVDTCTWLRDDPALGFDMLTDLTAVDLLPVEPRFEVVYHLYSTRRLHRLRLKVQVPEEEASVDSLAGVWVIADWLEREVFDMYGIRFSGHPNLKRILLYEAFVGHPLRKDYPKEKRQPLIRRPENEIAEALARRGRARPLNQLLISDADGKDGGQAR